jgi:hypothetical protein
MKRLNIVLITLAAITILGCGTSPQTMANKSCALYEKYSQAQLANDTAGMRTYELEMTNLDKQLTEEYMHKNPEWLMKYVKLRDACLKAPKQ